MYTYIYIYLCMYINTYICVCVYICMCIYIYFHIFRKRIFFEIIVKSPRNSRVSKPEKFSPRVDVCCTRLHVLRLLPIPAMPTPMQTCVARRGRRLLVGRGAMARVKPCMTARITLETQHWNKFAVSKEPCVLSKEPCILTKGPYILSKEPYHGRRRLDLKSLRVTKFQTSFHGSPRKFQTNFLVSPQIFKQFFPGVNGSPPTLNWKNRKTV